MRLKNRTITRTALFAAIIAVLSVVSVPIGTVPISLGLLGVFVSAICLGPARSAMAVTVYLFIGAIGLPVFSGFQAGFSVLTGPTGGYLLSYIAVCFVSGWVARLADKESRTAALFITAAGCLLGLITCYIIGTAFYSLTTDTSFIPALSVCVFPFVPFDLIKCIAAALCSVRLKAILK